MFTCFSRERQNVASVMDMFREICPSLAVSLSAYLIFVIFLTPALISSPKFDAKKPCGLEWCGGVLSGAEWCGGVKLVVWSGVEGSSGLEWYKLVLWSGLVWCGVLELTKVDFLFSSLDWNLLRCRKTHKKYIFHVNS